MGGLLENIALANGSLIAAFFTVKLFELSTAGSRLRNAYRLRLNLAIAALCAAAFPVLLQPITGLVGTFVPINATDIVVSQYLKGNIALSAVQIDSFLTAKDGLVARLVDTTSPLPLLLIGIFAIAAIIRAAYIAINIIRISRIIHYASLFHATRKVQILVSDRIEVPFSTRGPGNYYIILPQSLSGAPSSMKMAFRHEAQHLRSRDVDWEIVLSLVSPLFAINPAFWLITDRIRRFREYACDAACINHKGTDPRDYCLLLLDIASKSLKARQQKGIAAFAGSVPFFGRDRILDGATKCSLQQRVNALGNETVLSGSAKLGSLNRIPAGILLVLMIAIMAVFSKPAGWSHDRLMLSSVANLERLYSTNGFGVPPLR